ncbi:LPXTG cell wall anchor domain-containing protein [Streptomyces canus]|uniref:LPXTG cell wall anchor domain-containing protein n=1 Tax=Streptomyces canus TaxID=58343 RepID=UPI0027D83050|nr:LPXTG cell wall anchor domain-containing protein [Streptomyces canus]
MAAAATSILSLCGIPAFADAQSEGTLGGSLGALSGAPDAQHDDSAPREHADHSSVRGQANAHADIEGYGDSGDSDSGKEIVGKGDGGGSVKGVVGTGDGNGNHAVENGDDDAGYGDDDAGYGDDSDTPPTGPPTAPASPPVTTPPTRTPPSHAPPSHTPPSVKPPAGPPAQPPTLPETGAGAETIVGSGVAALLITGGVALYRRGRTTSRR